LERPVKVDQKPAQTSRADRHGHRQLRPQAKADDRRHATQGRRTDQDRVSGCSRRAGGGDRYLAQLLQDDRRGGLSRVAQERAQRRGRDQNAFGPHSFHVKVAAGRQTIQEI
jgi:hypothetical protein